MYPRSGYIRLRWSRKFNSWMVTINIWSLRDPEQYANNTPLPHGNVSLAAQLCFRGDVSEAGPLVSENDLAEDFLGLVVMTVVEKPVAESVTD